VTSLLLGIVKSNLRLPLPPPPEPSSFSLNVLVEAGGVMRSFDRVEAEDEVEVDEDDG